MKKKRSINLDLDLLGVMPVLHSQSPMASTFPNAFNAHSRDIWNTICNDADLKSYLKKLTPLEQWAFTIKEYLSRCKKNGSPPFAEKYTEQLNDALSQRFKHLRKSLVDSVNNMALLEDLKLYGITHSIQKLPTGGFDLTVHAKLRKVDGSRIERHINCLSDRQLWDNQSQELAEHKFDPVGRLYVSRNLANAPVIGYIIRATHAPYVNPQYLRDLTERKYINTAKSLWLNEISNMPLIHNKVKGARRKKLVNF